MHEFMRAASPGRRPFRFRTLQRLTILLVATLSAASVERATHHRGW